MSYSKHDVRRAGECLVSAGRSPGEIKQAYKVVNWWREVHIAPLRRLLECLEAQSSDMDGVLIAGRIKKISTIVDKLGRDDTPDDLRTFCDIAGCRIIVPSMSDLSRLIERMAALEECDRKKSQNRNYIEAPKDSGYRGCHLIYSFQVEGLLFKLVAELQLRTELQHAWATAVEMYDLAVLGSRLKFNEFDTPAGRFFIAASEIIRLIEEEDRSSVSWNHAVEKLRRQSAVSDVLGVLEACSQSVTVLGADYYGTYSGYCLLDINVEEQLITLEKVGASPNQVVKSYYERETRYESGHNTVLVRGATLEKLKRIYPNYFGDISQFVVLVRSVLDGDYRPR